VLAYDRNIVLAVFDGLYVDLFEHLEVALVESVYSGVDALAQGGDALLPVLEVLLLQLLKPRLVGIDNPA
jgi:hypothetical protein